MIRPADLARRFYPFFAKPRPSFILAEILASMSRNKPVHILQVGANDGVLYDPIHETLLRRSNVTATRIEPIVDYFEELKANCSNIATQVELFNICIGDEDGVVDIYLPKQSKLHGLGEKGHGSLTPEAAGRKRENLESRKVLCKSFKSLINDMRVPHADVYVSDCEGYDLQLLRKLPVEQLGVKVIFIELLCRTVISNEDVANSVKEAVEIVVSKGFNRLIWDGIDFLSWKSPNESKRHQVEVEGFTTP